MRNGCFVKIYVRYLTNPALSSNQKGRYDMNSYRNNLKVISLFLFVYFAVSGVRAQNTTPDLTNQPTLYVVPYAHLDTQWRWDYVQTIDEYLPATMHDNFVLFEKYPHYVFNFSGANRYRMMKEYYPGDYTKVKQYVAAGRWFPSGSAMEESDVNTPSAESLIRQILYGTHFFRREFGKTSAEYMLPDCFGFPASLPSILSHMGIKGFSTQKLPWGSSAPVGGPGSPQGTPKGIPFNVGYWEGLDGEGVIAALNATDYSADVTEDLSKSKIWGGRIQRVGNSSGLYVDYRYYGTGDIGGAPREASVKAMEAILNKTTTVFPSSRSDNRQSLQPAPDMPVQVGNGPIKILQTTAEQMFLDIPSDMISSLPKYKGDLELTEHSAGSLTSQAYMKRWNRKNELLADAAERASVAAELLGKREYPLQRLNDAWTLVLGGQFHDIIPGTSIPKAYEYSWNDEVLALNQFAVVLTGAVDAIASDMDTRSKGVPIVVYNPLSVEREDVVEATVEFPEATKAVHVVGPNGKTVPAQLEKGNKVLFLARVPPVGFTVYDIQHTALGDEPSSLAVTPSLLENERYRIRIDRNGDVSGILDKKLGKELLAAPLRLAIKTDKPEQWPAWNMDWADQNKPPRSYVGGPAKIRIVENGAARVAVEVKRQTEGSNFLQIIRLSAGDAGNRIEFSNVVEWKTGEANLKARFPLAASNPVATYNWDIGTIQRNNNDDKKYEVATHQWFDLTDRSGTFGVTVLSDCKYGSDKPDDNTLQLTLLRTPGINPPWNQWLSDQATQDWGRHEILYGLMGHTGDWRSEQSYWQAQRLNQPLIPFTTGSHEGSTGKRYSLLKLNNDHVRVLAVKKAEEAPDIIVRLVELDGRRQRNVRLTFADAVESAHEVNGQEQFLGQASVVNGELLADFEPYQIRTFALKLTGGNAEFAEPHSQPVALGYDHAVSSRDGEKSRGGFDAAGRAIPAEMLPRNLAIGGIHFKLAPPTEKNAVTARGQRIVLPEGQFTQVYIIAAADGDQKEMFHVGRKELELTIQDWSGYIGQWDNRIWEEKEITLPATGGQPPRREKIMEYKSLRPGYIKRTPVAWFASHRHTAEGQNEAYAYSYLYAYKLQLPADAETLTLPNNDKIRILAVTVSDEKASALPAHPLYDTLENISE
jgi:alpha-mannosidase